MSRRSFSTPSARCSVATLLVGASLLAHAAPAAAQPASPGAATVQVTLTNDACTASPASGVAGPITFQISDTTGDRVTEVELLNNDLIVGEKENLFPGASGSFSVNLPAGSYELYCPGANTEKTSFAVASPTVAAAGQPAVDPQLAAAFTQAASDYRVYVQQEVGRLVTTTQSFVDAVNAGDITTARQLYPLARVHYEDIEPVAESFGDLDAAIDMREDDAPDLSRFTGFHRLEKALWQDNSLAGMAPVGQQLVADTQRLQQLVNDPQTFSFDAAQVANGSAELLDEVAQSKITGEEERYSHLDLMDMAANIDGSRQGFQMLRPGLSRIDANLATSIDGRFAALDAAMAPYKNGTDWVSYTQLQPSDLQALSQAVNSLAEPVSQVAAKIVVATGGQLGASNPQP